MTDTTDRIIFPAKLAGQSEIDADSVRMKVRYIYTNVRLTFGEIGCVAFRMCEHCTGWTKKRSHRLISVILSNFNRLRLLAVRWPGAQSA